jgi:hypothetical protein
MVTMQDLLDQMRCTFGAAGRGNPWKWDYEDEIWAAIDDDGNLWRSDGEEGAACLCAS